jgi:hypothetical protein
MIKDKLDIKAFFKGKEIKIVPLKNIPNFFNALSVLSYKWKVEPFTKLWCSDVKNEINRLSLSVIIYLIYKYKFGKGYDVNIKKLKNEILLKTSNPKVFLMDSDYLTLSSSEFNSAIAYLKKINFIEENSRGGYININNSIIKYCSRMGDYLFNTDYCKESFKENTHYFGDHSSTEHYIASQEREQINEESLN